LSMKSIIAHFKEIISRINEIFAESEHDYSLPLGQVLIQQGFLTEVQLKNSLETQKNSQLKLGIAPHLGHILVEQDYVTESELLQAINAHYRMSVTSLGGNNIENIVEQKRQNFFRRIFFIRLPIWLQLSFATTVIILGAITTLSVITLYRQQEELYNQTVKLGTVSLNYFANVSSIPLLENNVLRLNFFLKEATSVEGIRYAYIVDNAMTIKAHTDHKLINTTFQPQKSINGRIRQGDVVYYNFSHPVSGEQLLNLTRPISFKDKVLGEVHVGVSIDFIDRAIANVRGSIIVMTTLIVLLGALFTIWLAFRFSRPIMKLVLATKELSRGHYQSRVDLATNDEIRDLALDVNRMSKELWLKSLMQESFGKYVGSEVLEMILCHPESGWVSGHRNMATILFADVRGFTAYSAKTEPEKIVESLNEFFDIASSTLIDHGGFIDKFIGDGVLAVFGVPIHHEDHEQRAIRAAVDLQQKLQEASAGGNRLLGAIGIGVNSGVVVAGNIGSQVKMEYTVIGSCVNVASRINGLAEPGEIIINDNVYEKVKELVIGEKLEPKNIKGQEKPVETYRVLGLKETSNVDAEK